MIDIETIARLVLTLAILRVMQKYDIYDIILVTPLVVSLANFFLKLQRPIWGLVLQKQMYEDFIQYEIMDAKLEVIWWIMSFTFYHFKFINVIPTFISLTLALIIDYNF